MKLPGIVLLAPPVKREMQFGEEPGAEQGVQVTIAVSVDMLKAVATAPDAATRRQRLQDIGASLITALKGTELRASIE